VQRIFENVPVMPMRHFLEIFKGQSHGVVPRSVSFKEGESWYEPLDVSTAPSICVEMRGSETDIWVVLATRQSIICPHQAPQQRHVKYTT
jgi:hypothetical protein